MTLRIITHNITLTTIWALTRATITRQMQIMDLREKQASIQDDLFQNTAPVLPAEINCLTCGIDILCLEPEV